MADVRSRAGDELDQLETQYQLAKSRIVRTALDSILLDKTINAHDRLALSDGHLHGGRSCA